MVITIWSVALTAWGITGLWLVGSGYRVGWAINFFGQLAWIAFAITFHAWGFILSACVYGFVNARNWRRWYLDQRNARRAES